jgi:NAD(P)-dependent dehydrogenase (short-subunit alcohol dehydrogenase family)
VPRVSVITGAASGIGRATALLLSERGDVVVALDRDAAGLAATVGAAASDRIESAAVDITDGQAVGEVIDGIAARHGRLDVLVTAAAIGLPGLIDEQPVAEWQATLDAVLGGTYHCSRAAIPHMRRARRGAIVTFGSVIGRTAITGFAAYGTAKGGIEAFTRALAVDYAADGIRVNCVVPGSTDTPMMWFGVAPDELAGLRAQVEAEQPFGRIAEPDEIARVVAFLASDEASIMTGATIVADGGVTARASVSY